MSDLPDMGTGSRRRFIALQPRVIVKTASKDALSRIAAITRMIDVPCLPVFLEHLDLMV
jgi:hypothetical protein